MDLSLQKTNKRIKGYDVLNQKTKTAKIRKDAGMSIDFYANYTGSYIAKVADFFAEYTGSYVAKTTDFFASYTGSYAGKSSDFFASYTGCI